MWSRHLISNTLTSYWARLRLKSPASRLFTQPCIQAHIKENIKAPRHWPLCGEFTGTGEFPAQMASYAENVSIWWRHHASTNYTTEWGMLFASATTGCPQNFQEHILLSVLLMRRLTIQGSLWRTSKHFLLVWLRNLSRDISLMVQYIPWNMHMSMLI